MLFALIFGFIGSAIGFVVASSFVSRGHAQRGRVALEDSGGDEYKIVFVTRYKVVPQVNLFPGKQIDHEFVSQYYTREHQRYRLELVRVTATGFTVRVHRLRYREEEGSIYRLPIGAHFDWRAEGIPDPAYDARSNWLKLTLPQKVFSTAGLLFLLGILADLAGLVGFAAQIGGR